MSNKYQVRIYRPMFGTKGGPSEVEHYRAATLLGALWIVLRHGTAARATTEARIFQTGSYRAA